MDRPAAIDELDAPTAAFVDAFRKGWALGSGAATFCEHFLPTWIDPDVTLVQPVASPAHGYDGFRRFAEHIFTLAPDLRCEVVASRARPDGVVLDLRFHGTIAGRPAQWSGRDTITLRDGRLLRREAEVQLGPLLRAAARSPRAIATLARASLPARPESAVDLGLLGFAVGRLTLGSTSRLAPGATARAFGAGDARSPELDYVTRVFGIRAIALGLGYLTSDGAARTRWQRLAFLCDISDTVVGLGDLVRGQVPRSTAARATLLTGTYTAIGAAAIRRDRQRLAPRPRRHLALNVPQPPPPGHSTTPTSPWRTSPASSATPPHESPRSSTSTSAPTCTTASSTPRASSSGAGDDPLVRICLAAYRESS